MECLHFLEIASMVKQSDIGIGGQFHDHGIAPWNLIPEMTCVVQ
jgi:hypothetical protein